MYVKNFIIGRRRVPVSSALPSRQQPSVMECIEIEDSADKYNQRNDDDKTPDNLVYYDYAFVVELSAYLVDEPRKSEPPQYGSADDTEIANGHLKRMVRYYERELGEENHEQEYYQRVEECHPEGGHTVVYERPFLVAADVHVFRGVTHEAVYTEQKKQCASCYFQNEKVFGICNKIHYKAHSKACDKRVYDVAYRGTDTCYESVPAALVECSLNTQNPDRPHRRRYKYSD